MLNFEWLQTAKSTRGHFEMGVWKSVDRSCLPVFFHVDQSTAVLKLKRDDMQAKGVKRLYRLCLFWSLFWSVF